MKTITLDYLRRWKWVFILTGVFQLFMVVAITGENSTFALFTVIYCGAMLLSFDLSRGTPRVCLALPVTRSELAWSWRFVAIVVPLCLFTVNLVLGNLLRGVFFSSFGIISLSQGTFWIFFALLWLGVSFHLLVHFPSPAMAQDPARKMKNNIIGGLWGLTLGGGFLVVMKMPKDWGELELLHWMLMAGALVSTVFGWQAAEELVVNRAGPARASEDIAKVSGRQEKEDMAEPKGEGFSLLFRTMAVATLRSLAVFMVVCIALQIFMRGGRQETWLETGYRVAGDPITFYLLVPLVLMTGLHWIVGIRHLRSLPIRASRLTLLVSGLFVLPTLVVVTAVGLLQLSLGTERISLEWVSRIALMTTPMLLAPGLLLRLGLTLKSYFLVIMPLFAVAPLATLLVPYLPVPVRGLICAVTWALGAFLTHRSITRRSETYRHTLTWPMRAA